MTGQLLQLVSNNNDESYLKTKYAIDNKMLENKSNTLIEIPRKADTVILDNIIINKNHYNYIKDLHILLGGAIIWNIPIALFKTIVLDDEIIINFKHTIFYGCYCNNYENKY